MLFEVRFEERDGWTVVSVVGDVDLATLPRLWAAMEPLTGRRVAIDLRAVGWFDPVCTGALVTAAQRSRRRDGRLVVLAGTAVAALLADTRLDQVLDVAEELPPSSEGGSSPARD